MRKFILILALCVLSISARAQTTYTVQLAWTASTASTTATPGTVSVYRAAGACPSTGVGTTTYTLLTATAPPAGPYVDSTVVYGATYCYFLEATVGAATSVPSATAQAVIPSAVPAPGAPTATIITVTVSVTH